MSERSHAPTVTRKAKAWREGRFPRSRDVTGLVVFLAGVYLLSSYGGDVMQAWGEFMSARLTRLPVTLSAAGSDAERSMQSLVLKWCLPFAGLLWLIALVSQLGQGGWVWVPGRVVPKFAHLRPAGLGTRTANTFSLLLKMMAVVSIVGCLIRWKIEAIFTQASGDQLFQPEHVARAVLATGATVAGVMLCLAALDYGWSWWRYHQSLRMTSEEMREEARSSSSGLKVRAALPAQDDRP